MEYDGPVTSRAPEATTTTYALLGLLSLRSWSGYELTAQARRSLHQVWPRSEANLYAEQKRLVALGWADAVEERVGNRPRRLYSITATGREALRAWLASPPAPPQFEVEGLLRVLFADQGDLEALRSSLVATASGARAALDDGLAIVRQYVEGEGPFPERAHLIALVGAVLADLYGAIEAHAIRAAEAVETWPGTGRTALDPDAVVALREVLERHAR